MLAPSVYHIIAIVSAVLLTCLVGAMYYICKDSRIIVQRSGQRSGPPSAISLRMQVLDIASVFLIHLGIPMPFIYIAFLGTDSDFEGTYSFLSTPLFNSVIIGHFFSLYFRQYVSR